MPDKDPVQLTERTANRLIRDASEWEGFVRGHPPRNRRSMLSDDGIFWGKTNQNWVKVAGNGSYSPSYAVDNKAGDNENTDNAFNIYLPRNGSTLDPNVIDDAVIPYIVDIAGDAICVGDYLDGVIDKSCEVWEGDPTAIATERPGWSIVTKFEEKFFAGWKSSGDYSCACSTGGFLCHGTSENDHTIHCLAHTHTINPALTCVDANQDAVVVANWSTPTAAATWASLNAGHSDSDNRPPWAVMVILIRADNSAAAP